VPTPVKPTPFAPAILGLTTLFAAQPAAQAQQAEQITVTGTQSQAATGSTVNLGSAEIARSGAASIGALLDELPSFGSQGVNNAQNDGGFGEYFIELHNLNFDRTVVLVDGQRFVLSGIQTDEAVDLNNIPASFIDHIEILKDGSQPRDAADAVAGVVNIVLKDQIEGIHLDGYGAAAGAGGDGTADISLTGGHAFANGHLAFGLDVFSRNPVLQSSRSWAADPIAAINQTPGGMQTIYGTPATPGGHIVAPGLDLLALGNGATRPFTATDDDNSANARDLQGGLQRATVYLDGDQALTDSMTANAELLFTERRATDRSPPATLGLSGTLKNPDGFTIPANDTFNPTSEPVTLERVVSEAGDQTTTTSGPVWRVLTGLDGVLGDWSWSAGFNRGQSFNHYVTDNNINLTRALQSVGSLPCPAPEGCAPADWFGPDSLSASSLAYLTYSARSQSTYTETIGHAALAGTLLPLPAGPLHLDLGADIRAETGATTVDAVTALGDQAGPDTAPTAGGYQTYEAFGTLAIPILRHQPGAERLALSLAGRATATSRYGAFGTYRAAAAYDPVQGLTLHAVTGIARRPPAISEAFGGITAAPQDVIDPCDHTNGLRANPVVDANCRAIGLGPEFSQAASQILVESGGNPRLRPEQSENEMLGVGIDPPAWPWLGATVDWYHYRIRDAIDSLADTDPNLIPDACFESVRLSSPLCPLITRIAGGGNAGQISTILATDQNVGTIKTDGVEFGLRLTAPPSPLGTMTLNWQTVWLNDYRIHDQYTAGFTQYAGTFPGLTAVGEYARVRSRAEAVLTHQNWEFGITVRYISGARVLGYDGPDDKAPGIFYEDADVQRHFARVTAMAGIDNIADQRPPLLIDGETNTDTNTYDVLGRVFWARLRMVF
jgi:outer membrane receptor protein involved in Fe transport